ncbi:copper resistance CopC family protein [Nocardia mangyaensis]|uniref:copper resistance CopC family protein n=1 Tax=Nocardia mangyaensis TaxID=2213200 RepID=UPI00267672E5|nr:copper resistance CopC family protein [Nocardia mangyaensis]MDO3647834.1 copper resistance protein CopC [Nocardia mangyaensis]
MSHPLVRSSTRSLARFATLFAAVFAVLALTAGPAAAHAALSGSDPADGARIDAAPARVTLSFNEAVQLSFASLTVVGPDGAHYEGGDLRADGNDLSTDLRALGAAGQYTVGYRVVSEDGHPIQGSYTFELTRAATPAPTTTDTATPAAAPVATAESEDGSAGVPVWILAVGVVLLVGAGLAVVLGVSRGKGRGN